MSTSAALSHPPPRDEVLERAQAGDPAAFVELVQRHDRALRALAWRLLRDQNRIDDVLQEAYIKAFRALAGFRGDAGSYTWLYRIVYNTCLDEIRRTGSVIPLPLDRAATAPAAGIDVGERVALRRDLVRALDTLPPEQRAAVLLVDAEGFDYAAAGEVLGVPAGTVGSRVSRARAALRAALDPNQGDFR